MGPPYEMSVHWRGLSSRGRLLPNDRKINHWALKIGDRYFELAYPLAEERDEILMMAQRPGLPCHEKQALLKLAKKARAMKYWTKDNLKMQTSVQTRPVNVPLLSSTIKV